MQKFLPILFLLFLTLHAGSPIAGYERAIRPDGRVVYTQKDGNTTLIIKRIIDTDNIYTGGKVDNYDDPYIAKILKRQTPCRTFQGTKKQTFHIVFNSQAQCDTFLQSKQWKLVTQSGLPIKLYLLDRRKLTLPLQLSVYPFFVIGDRFVQGVISPALLASLIKESDYTHPKPKIPLAKLKQKLKRIYHMDESKARITYDADKELFEVYDKTQNRFSAYLSRDGRYVMFPMQ